MISLAPAILDDVDLFALNVPHHVGNDAGAGNDGGTDLGVAFAADEQDAINSFYPDRKIKTFDILSFVQDMKNEE